MSDFLKPQSPLQHKDGAYVYPLTTADQVILEDNSRLNAAFENLVYVSEEKQETAIVPVDADTLGGQLPNYYAPATKLTPRNLLDNSDFRNPVNQRGVTTFTGGGSIITGYVALDRWLFYGADTTFAVTADGISAVNGGAATCGIAQRVEPGVIKAGKKYTLAFKGIVTGTVNLSCGVNATSITESRLVETGVNKIHLFTFTAADSTANGMYNIRIRSSNVPSTMDVEWIALYEGEYTEETLPEYQPKGYGAEMEECQRYFLQYNFSDVMLPARMYSSGGSADVSFFLPCTMRLAKPTVSVTASLCQLFADNSDTDCNITEAYLSTGNFVGLTAVAESNLTGSAVAVCRIIGKLTLSADL